jgi:hypothetical protein
MLLLTALWASGLRAFLFLLFMTSFASARLYTLQDDYLVSNFFNYFTFTTVRFSKSRQAIRLT